MLMEQQEQSADQIPVSEDKNKKTLADAIGDMLSLETHIEEALDRQIKQVADDAEAMVSVREFHGFVKSSREEMKALLEDYKAVNANPIKEFGSALLGKAAGLVDMIRTEGNSKSLRDDFTAFNLAAIGYTMLHTTAVALGDDRVAGVAEAHLKNYTKAIMQIAQVISDVVVTELEKDGHSVSPDAAKLTREMEFRAWGGDKVRKKTAASKRQ